MNIYFEIQNLNLAILSLYLAIPFKKKFFIKQFRTARGEKPELGDKMSKLQILYFLKKRKYII